MTEVDMTLSDDAPYTGPHVLSEQAKNSFLKEVKKVNPNADIALISKAYDFAKKAHANQTRTSGEPYFAHLLGVSYILLELKPGSSTLAAGLLHDILEDTKTKPDTIRKEFGDEILGLIEGVSKIKRMGMSGSVKESENLRKIILAMSKDIRIILIKLADRLHNMRTLKYLPADRQKKIARETLEIFSPIAYKLGMYKIKAELDDLSMRFLEPETYQDLKEKVRDTREEREKNISDAIMLIEEKVREKNVKAKIYGRAKHFYSIINKMKKKNLSFSELHDLLAVRIIVDNVEECYKVLGVIHESFRPIPGTMTDYIANPKPNMYQSLHTDVIWRGKPLEIQIRTWNMHYIAEYGIASHWRYKETDRDKKFDRRIGWLKQILEWQLSEESSEKFIENFKIDLFQNEIVVFTPKGDPIVLPEESTVIDFAYEIHTDIGNRIARAKVNNLPVPLDRALEPGDIVEIITQRNAKPSRSWLQIVKTTKAKQKIRQSLGLSLETDMKSRSEDNEGADRILSHIVQDSKKQLRYSKCCNPQIKDAIAGHMMKDGRIAVHKSDCVNLRAMADPQSIIQLSWKASSKDPNIQLKIEAIDRIGILADILNAIAQLAIDVRSVRTRQGKDSFFIFFELNTAEEQEVELLLETLRGIPDVKQVSSGRKRGFKLFF
jgi:GTP diphosphokinase / guanosine-3',5'-bis(diphosphate) 3'-diphosphatase